MADFTLLSAKYKIDIEWIDGNSFFKANQIGKLLGLKNIHKSINKFTSHHKVILKSKTNGGSQSVTFLTIEGFKQLLICSNKPKATLIAEEFGLDIINKKIISFENQTINLLMEAFDGEIMIDQYTIYNYRIDLYFPDYKLAIECDEDFHIYNKEKDNLRECLIKQKIGCKFIRYMPNSNEFNLLVVVNQIFRHIRNTSTCLTKIQLDIA
jgi:very-short-patch-repair endonuclease